MNLITSSQAQDHITPRQDAHWHKMWMNKESCIFEGSFAPSIITNNEIRIGAGVGSHQGRFFDVETGTYDTVTINNGTQGEGRIDIVCQKITVNTSGGTQSGSWEVIQGTSTSGTPVAPTVPTADLDAGDTESYMPILMVTLNGLNIASIDIIADVWSAADLEAVSELQAEVETINSRTSLVSVVRSNSAYTLPATPAAIQFNSIRDQIGTGLSYDTGTHTLTVNDANIKAVRISGALSIPMNANASLSGATVYPKKNGANVNPTGYSVYGASGAVWGMSVNQVVPVEQGDTIQVFGGSVYSARMVTLAAGSVVTFEAIY